jgi:hypothetical protein
LTVKPVKELTSPIISPRARQKAAIKVNRRGKGMRKAANKRVML